MPLCRPKLSLFGLRCSLGSEIVQAPFQQFLMDLSRLSGLILLLPRGHSPLQQLGLCLHLREVHSSSSGVAAEMLSLLDGLYAWLQWQISSLCRLLPFLPKLYQLLPYHPHRVLPTDSDCHLSVPGSVPRIAIVGSLDSHC